MAQKANLKKIKELEDLVKNSDVDITAEINRLKEKLVGSAPDTEESIWRKVELARNADRTTTLDIVSHISEDFVELHGDRYYGDDPALVGGICRIGGRAFTFMGHQRGRNMKENIWRNFGTAHPEGYRKALRLAQQAQKFKRPIITFIDTKGAYPGLASEERGVGEAIARNLRDFSVLKVPVVCFVIGEGGSGGALGIGVGNEVYMLENTTYSVISPEGCASILLRDSSKAAQAAVMMKITSKDLLKLGVIDGVLPEPAGGAHMDHAYTSSAIKAQIVESMARLSSKSSEQLIRERINKFMSFGDFESQSPKGGLFSRLFTKKD